MAYLTGLLLDLISKLMEKAEGGTYDRSTDSNEALSEAIAGIEGSDATLAKQDTIIADIATAQADLDNPSQYKSDATLSMQNTISGKHTVPSANTTANVDVSDAVGNKSDTKVEDIATTKSLMAYVKGLTQELAQRDVAKAANLTGTLSQTYVIVVNTNDKGILTGIWTSMLPDADNPEYVEIRITIDGTVFLNTILFYPVKTSFDGGSTISYSVNGGLAFNHRFDTSLKVEHRIQTSTNVVHTVASYTID